MCARVCLKRELVLAILVLRRSGCARGCRGNIQTAVCKEWLASPCSAWRLYWKFRRRPRLLRLIVLDGNCWAARETETHAALGCEHMLAAERQVTFE